MKTIVCQSFRVDDIPEWLTRCIDSVKKWAELKGFNYLFVDDHLFDYVPQWLFQKIDGHKGAASNLARLTLAKDYLGKGYERVIWVDVDVIIFDPEHFEINVGEGYAFCREVWMDKDSSSNKMQFVEAVNNAVSVFTQPDKILDFYIDACQLVVKNQSKDFDRLDIGTTFLTRLHAIVHFPLLTNVGLFSPVCTQAVAENNGNAIRQYIVKFGYPIKAANLCASLLNRDFNGINVTEALFSQAMDRLIETQGDIINRYLTDDCIAEINSTEPTPIPKRRFLFW